MTELNWHYVPTNTWWALPGDVNFRISMTECGTFVAAKYVEGWLTCESRWRTFDEAKDWCNEQRAGGEP
jgi:hypothetical protein